MYAPWPEIILKNSLTQEVISLLRSISSERLLDRHLIDRLVHGIHHCRTERLCDISDTQRDEFAFRMCHFEHIDLLCDIGKKVVVVANLKPAVLCGVESQGMILAADCAENDVKVVFVDGMPNGAKIR